MALLKLFLWGVLWALGVLLAIVAVILALILLVALWEDKRARCSVCGSRFTTLYNEYMVVDEDEGTHRTVLRRICWPSRHKRSIPGGMGDVERIATEDT